MKKKIVIGSMLAVLMLFVLSSAPMVESNTIAMEIRPYFLKQMQESKEAELSFPPFLWILITTVYVFFEFRAELWNGIAGYTSHFDVYKHPLLGLRARYLEIMAQLWGRFWQSIAESYGWKI